LSLPETLGWFGDLPLRIELLALATLVVLVELGLRRFAPKSGAYRRWTGFFQAIGSLWTAILLAIVYVLSVGPVGLVMRLMGNDPLDRRLTPEVSFWRAHEPSPLGTERAALHQF
jgi:membrane-associated protease RseP (regulator of RpoE activity)